MLCVNGCILFENFGTRLFFDISSPSKLTFGSKQHWLPVVDDMSNFIWSFFLKVKSNLADTMVSLIENLKNIYNLQVQYLCCDYARENVAFKHGCKQGGLGEDFKYTALGVP